MVLIMYDQFIKNLEPSGSYNGEEPNYNLLRLGEQYNRIIDSDNEKDQLYETLCDIYEEFSNLLVTRTKYEKIFKGIHISSIENYDSIFSLGLKIPNNINIPNLGKGIYAVRNLSNNCVDLKEEFAYDGHINLRDWVLDLFDTHSWDEEEYLENLNNTKICLVEFEYTGYYDECIYGDDHVGFIVIREDIPPESITINKISLSEYLAYY